MYFGPQEFSKVTLLYQGIWETLEKKLRLVEKGIKIGEVWDTGSAQALATFWRMS